MLDKSTEEIKRKHKKKRKIKKKKTMLELNSYKPISENVTTETSKITSNQSSEESSDDNV